MSKNNHIPRTLAQAAKIAGYHAKECEEMALDTARRMVADQAEWLDGVMKDLLPPELYAQGQSGEDPDGKIAAYVAKHGIQVVYIPDTLRIRVMLQGKVHAEFRTELTVDGEPVSMKPERTLDGSQN